MRVIAVTLLGALIQTTSVSAQSWTAARTRPPLWQINSVDASGEPGWPYGSEDIAGDGTGTFPDDEAGADLRTAYADADADRLWLRAYVSGDAAPAMQLVAFFFLDIDGRDDTGGDAAGMPFWRDWDADPSAGGYERAVGVRGNGTLIGAYGWMNDGWIPLPAPEDTVVVEVGSDRDPILFGTVEHGYVQVMLDHSGFGLDASCDGDVYVRLWHDGTGQRSFGDDDDAEAACRAPTDRYGDPNVLRRGTCNDDDDCPADGTCEDGVCMFEYACSRDGECRGGERCTSGACSGGGAGAAGSAGRGGAGRGGSGGASGGSAGTAGAAGGGVRGGAFSCSAAPQRRDASLPLASLLLAAAALGAALRRGRRS